VAKPNPLDVALGAADGAKAKGFFQALKPKDTVDFGSTSRVNVANPKGQKKRTTQPAAPQRATNRFLADPKKKTVADESTQATLAALTLGQTPQQKIAKSILAREPDGAGDNPVAPWPLERIAHTTAPASDNLKARAQARAAERNIATPSTPAKTLVAHPRPGVSYRIPVSSAPAGSASILSAVQNAQNLGIPFGNLSTDLQEKARSALFKMVAAPTGTYPEIPNIGMYSAADKAKAGLPYDATDGDVQRKLFAKLLPHKSWLTQTIDNVPRSALNFAEAPVFLANVTGDVLGKGVLGGLNSDPKDAFGAFQGDWDPAVQTAEEFGREQVDFAKSLNPLHPYKVADTLQHDPIGTLSAGLAATRLAGAGAGMAARAGALGKGVEDFATPTPRHVLPAGYFTDAGEGSIKPILKPTTEGGHLIPRGLTSKNLDQRVVEAASDWLATKSKFFGSRLEKGRALATKKETARLADERLRRDVEPALKAVSHLKGKMRRAVLFARGQGVTEEELASHFEGLADEHRRAQPSPDDQLDANSHAHWKLVQRDLDNSAKDWRQIADHVAKKGGLSPEDQVAIHLSTRASRAAEEYMKGTRTLDGDPLLKDFTAQRRAYYTYAKVKARAGDRNAQEFLSIDQEVVDLSNRLARALKGGQGERVANRLRKRIVALRMEQHDRADVMQREADRRQKDVEVIGKRQANVPLDQAERTAGRIADAQDKVGDRHQSTVDRFHEMWSNAFNEPDKKLPSEQAMDRATQRATGERQMRDRMEAPVDAALERAPADDARARARIDKPVADQLEVIGRAHERAAAKREFTTKAVQHSIDRAEAHLATHDPEVIQAQLEDAQQRLADSLAQVRHGYRNRNGAPVESINRDGTPNEAPLDEHDPLYFPHIRSNPGILKRRIYGGQGGGAVNMDARPKYGKRLGDKSNPFSGQVFDTGGAETDPAVFFGAVAKPARVATALKHLQDQVSGFSVKVRPGQTYDARHWVELHLDGKNVDHPLSAQARTSLPHDQSIEESDPRSMAHKMLSHFQDRLDSGTEGMTGVASRSTKSHMGTVSYKTVPPSPGTTVLVSRHAFDALQNDFLHGGIYDTKAFQKLQSSTQAWRWATLLARPAWLTSNVVGNTIQAATAGAGPISHIRALGKGVRDDDSGLIPARVHNAGFAKHDIQRGVGAPLPHRVLGKLGDTIAQWNVNAENWSRRAVYLRHAAPAARAAAKAEGERISRGFIRTNKDLEPWLKKLGVDEQAEPNIVKIVNHWLGEFHRSKNTPILDFVSPFHRWYEFITKLVVTMPAKTPGRALLLQRMGAAGFQMQNQEFGGFQPNSMVGSIGLGHGIYKSTQSWNPYATVFQMLDPEDQTGLDPGHPGSNGLFQSLNPAITDAIGWASGKDPTFDFADMKNGNGTAVGHFNPAVLARELETIIPLTAALQGYGQSDASWNPFSPDNRKPGLFSQPASNAAEREIGYLFGSVRPYDPKLQQFNGQKALQKVIKSTALATAK
jgi:hypothetical protein